MSKYKQIPNNTIIFNKYNIQSPFDTPDNLHYKKMILDFYFILHLYRNTKLIKTQSFQLPTELQLKHGGFVRLNILLGEVH